MYIITKKEAYRRALDILRYHLKKYEEYKYASGYGSIAARRIAHQNMGAHAALMLQELKSNSEVRKVVLNSNPYQFEDFHKYAASDVPDYIDKIQKALDELVD